MGGAGVPRPGSAPVGIRERRRNRTGARPLSTRTTGERTHDAARLDLAPDGHRAIVDRRAAAVALLGRDHRRRLHRSRPTRWRRSSRAGLEPAPEGTASVVFADWCSASDHDDRVLADPGDRPVPRGVRRAPRAPRRQEGRARALHLGRQRAVAPARSDPGLPQEARADRDDQAGRARARRRAQGDGRDLRRARDEPRAARAHRGGHARGHDRAPAARGDAAARAHPALPLDRSARARGARARSSARSRTSSAARSTPGRATLELGRDRVRGARGRSGPSRSAPATSSRWPSRSPGGKVEPA